MSVIPNDLLYFSNSHRILIQLLNAHPNYFGRPPLHFNSHVKTSRPAQSCSGYLSKSTNASLLKPACSMMLSKVPGLISSCRGTTTLLLPSVEECDVTRSGVLARSPSSVRPLRRLSTKLWEDASQTVTSTTSFLPVTLPSSSMIFNSSGNVSR